MDSNHIIEGVLTGRRRMAARAISLIEDEDPSSEAIVRGLFEHTGQAYSIGFTGPPGAGKSTLVDDVVHIARSNDRQVGVIAVDPNSPFSGGAILGDRIRMMRHTVDENVFIRSMGSRGHLGGLALATSGAVYVLDAMGVDLVILETVGVGQSELEVAGLADTTVVVLMPGLGDGVQTIKAGIMEIADIFVVNKADHPAVQKTIADLKDLLRLETCARGWKPEIVTCIATQEVGVQDLWNSIGRHRAYLESSGELDRRRAQRFEQQIVEIATDRLRSRIVGASSRGPGFQATLRQVIERQMDPFTAAEALLHGELDASDK